MPGQGSFHDAFARVAECGTFLDGLAEEGVGIRDLKNALANPAHMAIIAAAILSPSEGLKDHWDKLTTVASNANLDPFVTALSDGILHRQEDSHFYSEPARVAELLGQARYQPWQRAAIVLFYGLGGDPEITDHETLSGMLKRAKSTIHAFLGKESREKISSAHIELSRRYVAKLVDQLALPKAPQHGWNILFRDLGIFTLDALCELSEEQFAERLRGNRSDYKKNDEYVESHLVPVKEALSRMNRSFRP